MNLPTVIGLWSPAPGSGKSTVAAMICNATGLHQITPFASPLKRMVMELLLAAGYDEPAAQHFVYDAKHEPLELIPDHPTARRLLQTLGSEWGRDMISPDLWVELWRNRATALPCVVADDVRRPNEAAAIAELGGELWAITRPGVTDVTGHISESGLGDLAFDRVIVNDGTFEDLLAQVLR